jgi:nitroimidazol reductase NimA-like FMN-containing flavoprotein (pyridoxamine 5'-phosphate oxidase superfamily)
MERRRTSLGRHPERGREDRALIDAILDEGVICHVGFVVDGYPAVIPTVHARSGSILFLHGSSASRMLEATPGTEICVVVTLVDGIVMARSAFNHSINYRSVVLYGRPRLVVDVDEKMVALQALVEHVAHGRWADARRPTSSELTATRVIALPVDEVSAKVRTGPPKDDPADLELATWAGVVPLTVEAGVPEPDPALRPATAVPGYVRRYRRPRARA